MEYSHERQDYRLADSDRGFKGLTSPAQAPGPVLMSLSELKGAIGDLTGYVSNLENRTASVCRPALPVPMPDVAYAGNPAKAIGASVAVGEITDCTRVIYDLRRRLGDLMDRLEI